MLKFVKTLALFGYFDFNDFHSTFDKFACLFYILNSSSVCCIIYLAKAISFLP
ncbi:hypothetical protein UNSWCS_626 [Campylobacter concisus UNSWCS]|uniref:Uncharacterized protein n=1 Tax=Campylobacter concisus UNSWCS TaxID=1242968 RepID=U2FIM4_9BACT|nr:hypothetical protein UNSWCS_626 [Campylobacter concisus UNSWCS]